MRLLSDKISARISSKRRSRLAGPAVILLGLLLTGGLYAMFAPANGAASTANSDDVAKGRALFLVSCASCHGKNAEGIVTRRGHNHGPSLVGVGAAAVDFQVSTGRMPMAQPGVQALRKTPVFNSTEIRQLGAYVASLGPGPAVPSSSETDINGMSADEISRGGEFFRTNCTACHNFQGHGGAMPEGKFAPKIYEDTPRQIFEAMITGPQQMPVFADSVLSPQDKREIVGYIKAINSEPGYGGFSLGSLGPVSEGLFAWIVGIGVLVLAAIWIAAHTARSKKKVEADA
ncbi:cytochrome bc1 complex diheme cytochrome c subunit [Nocardioides terrisoli]|uniref:cytochrome bc1 complex diheme cytochrome c subunit n=1 Tax=Nocardioides terrisoli TaxID=3388267 RepID=UPI00287BB11E|nr:cytochrome c [Nocardioides marmorisolisilvae]